VHWGDGGGKKEERREEGEREKEGGRGQGGMDGKMEGEETYYHLKSATLRWEGEGEKRREKG
jgi:hypothetical protein